MNANVIFAIFKRNFVSYFSSVTGYLFICVFVIACAAAAYWPNDFFNANLANLDQLNEWLPWVLLIFIPAITMSIWADERRQGTDELLLTIPASDFDVVIGKYLAAVAIFTASLLFSLVNYIWLARWGNPDLGLFLGNYFGYWMVGLAMLAIGMVASFLTSNLTVGFVLGVIFNLPLVFAAYADTVLPGRAATAVKGLSISEQFRDFGQGVISFSSVIYFVLITVVMLYLSMLLIGRRHWWGGRDGNSMLGHYILRALALMAIAIGVSAVFARTSARVDVTSEQLSSLSPQTERLLRKLEPKYPVVIDAYVSPTVPESYVQTRLNLLNMLREFEKIGTGDIRVNVHETAPLSEQAIFAEEQFGIQPQQVASRSRGAMSLDPVIMGVACTSGLNKVVIPFIDRGVPVEYELVRSIATVAQQKRKKVGVLTTDAKLYGGFNMQAMSSTQNEQIIGELEKQYDVVQVNPESPIEERYDVLLAVQPSSLSPEQMENFLAAVKSGQPTAIFEDPFPYLDPSVPGTAAPKQPPGGMNPFMGQQPPVPKGNIGPLWDFLGIDFSGTDVVWQDYNPYPKIGDFPKEFVFASLGSGAQEPFSSESKITSELQQMLFLFPGSVRRRQASELKFAPLVVTGDETGTVPAGEIVQMNRLNPNLALARVMTGDDYVLAAHIRGKLEEDAESFEDDAGADDKKPAKKAADKPTEINAVVVADIDCLYSAFFSIRQRGDDPEADVNLDLDNVTFVLNTLDTLAGDDRFVKIRSRRREHRTLTAIEERIEEAKSETNNARKEEMEKFNQSKEAEQREFDKRIDKIQQNKRLDELTKVRQIALAREVGQQRLQRMTERLERERDQKIRAAERKLNEQNQRIQTYEKLLAVVCAPILPLAIGIAVFFNLRSREKEGVNKSRLV